MILRKWSAWLLIVVLLSPGLFLTTVNAETAPSFLLDTHKSADGKITLTMSGKNIVDLYGYEARLSFDPERLELVSAESKLDGFSVSPIIKNNEIIIAHTKIGNVSGDNGDMTIGSLTFKPKKYGETAVKWKSMKMVTHKLKSTTTTVGISVSVSKSFVDLTGHWAREDIELLASMGIIEGMDANHFMPEAKVTRAQFAAMVTRALKLKETTVKSPFADVLPDSWYARSVSSAYAAGVIQGITASSFAPERNITREEMVVMLVRAGKYASEGTFKEAGSKGSITFVDEHSVSEWAINDIELAVLAGIIKGRTDNTFGPQANASRAEAGVVIKRLLNQL